MRTMKLLEGRGGKRRGLCEPVILRFLGYDTERKVTGSIQMSTVPLNEDEQSPFNVCMSRYAEL